MSDRLTAIISRLRAVRIEENGQCGVNYPRLSLQRAFERKAKSLTAVPGSD